MEWTQAHNSFKHLPKEIFDSNFYTLLALKKNKFVKDNRWSRHLQAGFGPSIMEPVNWTTPSKRFSSKETPSIDKSLCGKEVSFIHIHRERNGRADTIAKGVGL
ncbi:hypothetical protein AMTRI_Chr09g40540 [Amborella trichopoda]